VGSEFGSAPNVKRCGLSYLRVGFWIACIGCKHIILKLVADYEKLAERAAETSEGRGDIKPGAGPSLVARSGGQRGS
jgi:hypothetical protein